MLCNLGILLGVDIVTQYRLQEDVVGDLRLRALAASNRIDQQLDERYLAIEALAETLANVSPGADIQGLVNAAFSRRPAYSWIGYATGVGIVSAGTPETSRPWFKPTLTASYVREVNSSSANGISPDLVEFGFPVRSTNGGIKGVLGASLSKDWLAEFLAPSKFRNDGKGGYDLLVVDRQGLVIIGPPSLAGSVLPEIVSLPDGQLVKSDEQVLSIAATTRGSVYVPSFGWRVVVRGNQADLFALGDAVRRAVLLSTVPVLLFCLFIAYFVIRKITGPIEALTAAVDSGREIPLCLDFEETAKLAKALREALGALQQEKEQVALKVLQRTAELDDLMRVVNAHTIISMTDENWVIVDCNDLFCSLNGYTRDEMIGQSYHIIRSDFHPQEFFEELERTVRSGQIWQGLICNRAKNGRLSWVQTTVAPVSRQANSKVRYISIRTDITATIEDRQELSRLTTELMMFRRILDNTAEGVSVMDNAGRYIYCNPARERMTGVTLEKLRTYRLGEGFPKSAEGPLSEIREAVASGKTWTGLLPFYGPDGKEFTSSSNIGVVSDEDGLPQYIFNIFQDHTQELARTKELEGARNAAEGANKAKSEFLSNMSHELRTPLNAILGFAQILMMGRKNPLDEKQTLQVQQILKGGEHLLELINEVLDMAKIEAGRLSLSIEPISARELLDECIALAAPIMARYDVTLNGCQCSDLPAIVTDRVRAKQVLLNLLSNAAKYNRPGGTVTLSCEKPQDGYMRFNVIDTGLGVPNGKLQELFMPFSRLGAEMTEIEGTGIGLALTKKLVEAMNGRIGVESREGVGSRFWLEFPISDRPVSKSSHRAFAAKELRGSDGVGILVLYVEDNPSNIKLMEGIFDSLPNMLLVTAMNAELGLDLALAVQPSLIIMDVNLPEMNGIEAVRVLKQTEATAAIPVIALSADATPGTIAKGRAAGFDAYVTKPLDVTHLVNKINALLGNDHD